MSGRTSTPNRSGSPRLFSAYIRAVPGEIPYIFAILKFGKSPGSVSASIFAISGFEDDHLTGPDCAASDTQAQIHIICPAVTVGKPGASREPSATNRFIVGRSRTSYFLSSGMIILERIVLASARVIVFSGK